MEEGRRSGAPIPSKVGRYDVLLPIASGGMATVYLARSRGAGGFEREVALKLTHAHLAESPEFSRELLEEAKLAVAIRHANVVAVLDVGDDANGLFLVMEYIEGDTLSGLMRRANTAKTPLDPSLSIRVLLDALAGLHAAHELADEEGRPLGLVHRDFSPQNILVGTDGIGRLADFGIAKAASRLGATRTGMVKGKIGYMAPEQARGEPLDRRTDVWAAGVLAWELVAGQRLYNGDELGTLFRIASDVPPLLRTVKPDVNPALEAAIARALTPDLAVRTPTAAALAKDLAAALRQTSIELSESSDVAAIVKQLAGPKLAERRKRAKEVLDLRQELDNVARSTVESLTPGTGHAPPPARAPTDLETPASLPGAAAPTIEQPGTDTNSVSAAAERVPPRRRSGLVALVAVGAVALTILGIAASTRGARPDPRRAPAVTATDTATTPAEPAATAAKPSADPMPTPAVSAVATPPSATASARAPSREGAASRARPPPAQTPATKSPAPPSFLDVQH